MIRHVVRAIPGALLALSVPTGIALWLTYASFGLFLLGGALDGASVRAAMLPPWWTLALAILLAFVGLVAIVVIASIAGARRMNATHPTARLIEVDRRTVLQVVLPSAALGLLLLPYLPWLPDRLPILWVLAGPGRLLLWIVVAWLVARGVWLLGGAMPLWLSRQPWQGALAIFLVSAVVCGSAAVAYKRSVQFPGGDEPHYLIIAQSLWRDHDLRIEKNYRLGDYREYFDRDLEPHYLTRGVDNQIYSVHPVGMPILIAPVYALGGYELVVYLFVAMASAAAALLWLVARQVTDDAGAATAAWAACCLNSVWVFNSLTVYPEVPAALATIAAFALIQRPPVSSHVAWRRWLVVGLALSTLPWLSTKYAPMSAMLVLIAFGRVWRPTRPSEVTEPPEVSQPARRAMVIASAGVLVPYLVSLALWFTFFYVIWGTPWPSAPYGTQQATSLRFLLSGGPGLLFDQEYGLLAFAPALIVSLVGLVAMWRAGGSARRLAVETAVPFAALLVTVGAFPLWWGGTAVAGRPLISGLLLLGVPFAWRYHQLRDRHAILGAFHVLVAIGAGFGLSLAFAENGLMLSASRNGMSRLLQWLSSDWSLWSIAPAYITETPFLASVVAAFWLVAACAAGWWLRSRAKSWTPGRAMLSAVLTCALALLLLSIALPLALKRWLGTPSVVPISGQSRLLDEFDAARRPIAILFDPMRRVDPQRLLQLAEFVARPEDRRPKPPIPLLYNARFALPAGRYDVELVSSTNQPQMLKGSLALQLGRIGAPARQWDVDMTLPGIWGRAFDLPIDVGFVGFRGSPELEQAKPTLRIRPVSIVDAHARLPAREVLATHSAAQATLFFHDESAVPEHDGFWTPGRSRLAVTVAASHVHPPRLRLRAGPVQTRVRVRTPGWQQELTLEPSTQHEVVLPMPVTDVARVVFETSTGFVSALLDPASHDRRFLGCWVELNPPDPLD